ncbi:helix-turn-helix transcriptional regulator [Parathalassolituus penaei]|uniref:WYL domain-containing protein n=1 Tax=Parathalassolituus penaei TaxID=2997323 RepID=A0A9X3ER97_9GAMM|nr:WYL domain-containing protein [Parathalassolituus penaei]MCY0967438.1 WYL domain-containing protein [Parathalassolituus penaei]
MSHGSKDTLLRYIETLNLIPRLPTKIATTTLEERLRERGYEVSARTIQRDLDRLSLLFPIRNDTDSKPYRWYYEGDIHQQFPVTNTPAALAWCLAEPHLRQRLPAGVFQQLQPQFKRASLHLTSLTENSLADWPQRIRALPTGKTLLPAEIKAGVWEKVGEALLLGQQLQVQYFSLAKGETRSLRLHPLALVMRDNKSYLVAMANDYEQETLYALHRISEVDILDAPARQLAGFDLDDYIRKGTFGWQPQGDVTLVAEIAPEVANLLRETPLSLQQSIEPLPDSHTRVGWYRLEAIVADDLETLWWVFSMNSRLKVQAPQHWVEEIHSRLRELCGLYEFAPEDAASTLE